MATKQYILTYPQEIHGEDAGNLMRDLANIAHAQDKRYRAFYNALAPRGSNIGAEEVLEATDGNLTEALCSFAPKHQLNKDAAIRYFGGPLYPSNAESVAMLSRDYSNAATWPDIPRKSFGDAHKVARIMPTALTTDEAVQHIRANRSEFEQHDCIPIIIEISGHNRASVPPRLHHVTQTYPQILRMPAREVMKYLCGELCLEGCTEPDRENPGQGDRPITR